MSKKDYYKILGIKRTASAADIKRVYLELIKQYHPDINPEDKHILKKFQEITEAYHVLGDLDRRLKYSNDNYKEIEIENPPE